MSDHVAKKEPPKFKNTIETQQFERLNHETAVAEELRGAVNGGARFRSGVAKRGAFESSDAHPPQFVFSARTKRNGRGVRVAHIRAGRDFEEGTHVRDGARHGSNDADPAERACSGRKMTGGGNATGRRLESTDSAEMRGDANGTAAVATDAAHRAA